MKEEGTNFRICADGEVVHEDDFEGMDYCPDGVTPEEFTTYFIPDAVLVYLKEAEENPKCSFCSKTKKELGTPVITGANANICYKCVSTNKKKLEEA